MIEEEDDYDEDPILALPIDRWDVPITLALVIRDIASSVSKAAHFWSRLFAGHQDYRLQQRKMQREAAAEIERMTS